MENHQAVVVSYARPATDEEQAEIAKFLAGLPWECQATRTHVIGPTCLLESQHLDTRQRMKRHIDHVQHVNGHADVSEAKRRP
jgi:hypothetical protein